MDDDLLVAIRPLPDGINALENLRLAEQALSLSGADESTLFTLAAGNDWDPELAKKILSQNEEALAHLEAALERPGLSLQDPAADLNLVSLHYFGTLLNVRAHLLLEADRQDEAWQDDLRILHLGQMLEKAGADLTHYLLAIGLEQRSLKQLQTFVPETKLDAGKARDLIDEIVEHRLANESLVRAFKVSYSMNVGLLEQAGHEYGSARELAWKVPLVSRYLFKPNETRALYARSHRALIAHVPKPCEEKLRLEGPEISTTMGKLRVVLAPNSVGRILHEIGMPSFPRIFESKCGVNNLNAVVRLLIALKSYHTSHDGLPATLDELVPDYFEALPVDEHDHQGFRYAPAERSLRGAEEVFEIEFR